MPDVISLDYETYYSTDFSVVDLGYWKYTRDPRHEHYMVSVCDGKETWSGSPDDFDFSMLDGKILLSHNAAFDQEVMLSDVERGRHAMPKFLEWHCTANMASYLWNVRSLADAVRVGLGQAVDKGARDRAKGKHWANMVADGSAEDMLKYARHDAQHCWTLWDKFGKDWPDWERRLSDLTIRQGRHGVQIDVPRLEDYMQTLGRVIFTAQSNLPWIERGRPPASPLGMAEECRAAGIPCPPVKAHDPEAAEEWEEMYAPQYKWVMAVRNLRKAKKALATMETIKSRLRPDGTVAFSLKYFGAHTGRWAGDAGWNLQNQPKSPLFVKPDGTFELDAKTIKKMDAAWEERESLGDSHDWFKALDIRGLICARPGHKLAMSDLAQIEPRVLNWMAGNHALLELVSTGMSIYEAHARTAMGWTGGDLKKEDKKLYQLAKIQVLGLGYGCGWDKFITIAAAYDIDLTEEDEKYALLAAVDGKIHRRTFSIEQDDYIYESCPEGAKVKIVLEPEHFPLEPERVIFVQKVSPKTGPYLQAQGVYGQQSRAIVQQFRDANPLIVGLWKTMDDQLAAAQGADLEIDLPSGRKLTYRKVRMEIRKFEDPETKKKTERRCLTAEIGGRRTILYGGMIVENVTQAIGRDVFAHNLLACEDAGEPSLFTVHDENVVEFVDDGDDLFDSEAVQSMMERCPGWLRGCPVAAETKVGERYAK